VKRLELAQIDGQRIAFDLSYDGIMSDKVFFLIVFVNTALHILRKELSFRK